MSVHAGQVPAEWRCPRTGDSRSLAACVKRPALRIQLTSPSTLQKSAELAPPAGPGLTSGMLVSEAQPAPAEGLPGQPGLESGALSSEARPVPGTAHTQALSDSGRPPSSSPVSLISSTCC